jgi:hypothetical protein
MRGIVVLELARLKHFVFEPSVVDVVGMVDEVLQREVPACVVPHT